MGKQSYVLAIDQGTTSTRAIVFDGDGRVVGVGNREHKQHYPRAGWIEHDPREIMDNLDRVVRDAMRRLRIRTSDLAAVGIANQRETVVVWDRRTGRPIHRAIVWQDTRTQPEVDALADGDPDRFRAKTGLTLSSYFAGPKAAWILDHVRGARAKAERGDLAFGTMDSWLVWNLTGGPRGGVHVTDVTNASRTLLMNLTTCDWDPELCELVGVPMAMLPTIVSSSEVIGEATRRSSLAGVPIAGILGDQQAAAFGQTCFEPGSAKNTYGTGSFLLMNTGVVPVPSQHGLLTTVLYQLGNKPPVFALEGPVADAGSVVQWLRDEIGMISKSADVDRLASTVRNTGGAYIVPAFSGLYAPRWRPDARGTIVGLTRFVTKAHLARAALECTAFSTWEVVNAMNNDVEASGLGTGLRGLRVDGGMVGNDSLMQLQSDLLNVPVVRPEVPETTALGAAYAAGLAVDMWQGLDELAEHWRIEKRWDPQISDEERARRLRVWNKAVEHSIDWVDTDTVTDDLLADEMYR
ncbi:glycerol kinase GlpK [Nigerium massiliense]|uniref:glycerol kinase GlpK n=1 Tax=Nigerium massiliense TaxID=1522317 RepID=UPI0006950890|nr:glycerol kinase GlpK [Nigerium massiliense]